MSREVIAVDLDDVLAFHYEVLAEYAQVNFGATNASHEYSSALATLWNVPTEEAIRRMWQFHNEDLLPTFKPIPDAVEVIGRLEDDHEFVVVTARPRRAVEATHTWLNTHFPSVFRQIAFVHTWEGDTATKADKCKELGADYLIDDTLRHCLNVAEVGITGLLYGGREGQGVHLPENVILVENWAAIEAYFHERS